MWVLSDQPIGSDKYIFQYSGGSWTNIPGLASQIAVAPDGSLYAINSAGGVYHYAGSTWTNLGGGASSVAAGSDSSVYVVSNSGGVDRAIWQYIAGNWTQAPGSGVSVATGLDTQSHTIPAGTLMPGGIYIINSIGAIYYSNPNGSFVKVPGNAVSLASTPGGIFALGYPSGINGAPVYYYDLDNAGWATEPGSGVSVSSSANTLYVVSVNGGIYSSPITPVATPAPPAVGAAAACGNPVAATQPTGYTNIGASFFSMTLANAKQICLSAWVLSSDLDNALLAAKRNGANVAVLTPYSQKSSNNSDYATLNAAGIYTIWEYTGGSAPTVTAPYQSAIASPMDIHAKFALVDGVAYMNGHNWFTTDVVMRSGVAGDYAAMQDDLLNFPTPAAGNGAFTTDKQVSLASEAVWMNSQTWGPSTEYDFITESFNPVSDGEHNQDVYNAMCTIAKTGAVMHLQFESFSGYSTAAKTAVADIVAVDPNAVIHTNNNGHEKISMMRGGSGAWFGSSNMTTTDLFDWGYTLSDAGMISALQTYFDGQFTGSSVAALPASTGAYCHI